MYIFDFYNFDIYNILRIICVILRTNFQFLWTNSFLANYPQNIVYIKIVKIKNVHSVEMKLIFKGRGNFHFVMAGFIIYHLNL